MDRGETIVTAAVMMTYEPGQGVWLTHTHDVKTSSSMMIGRDELKAAAYFLMRAATAEGLDQPRITRKQAEQRYLDCSGALNMATSGFEIERCYCNGPGCDGWRVVPAETR